jgi:hypothetical protein
VAEKSQLLIPKRKPMKVTYTSSDNGGWAMFTVDIPQELHQMLSWSLMHPQQAMTFLPAFNVIRNQSQPNRMQALADSKGVTNETH